VGYCLLDLNDRYGIRSVAVYFVRHEWMCSWPLWRLVFPPADVVRFAREGHEPFLRLAP
jgi:hypothetical protein